MGSKLEQKCTLWVHPILKKNQIFQRFFNILFVKILPLLQTSANSGNIWESKAPKPLINGPSIDADLVGKPRKF